MGGDGRIGDVEAAVEEEGCDERRSAHRQCGGSGKGEQHRQLDRIGLNSIRALAVLAPDIAGQHWQDRRAEGDADDAERKLVQPVGEIKVAQRSVGQPRDEEQLDQLVDLRSEEHTSELQSLMRSSYAVFCLKKKNR